MNDSIPPSSSDPTTPPPPGAEVKKDGKSASPWSLAFLRGSLPRLVGYGLLGLFTLDVVSVLLTYKPFQPESDANLVMQLIERVGVPLVACAFIFGSAEDVAGRRERTMLKLLAIGTLVGAFAYLGLAAMSVTAGLRIYTRAVAGMNQQEKERIAVIERAHSQLGSFNLQQLQLVYVGMVPGARAQAAMFSRPELEAKIIAQIPATIDAIRDDNDKKRLSIRRQQILASGRYFIGGVISAVLFLIVWENTSAVRQYHILRQRDAPNLVLEDKLVGGLARFQNWAESLSIIIWLDRFRWFRRFRRMLGFKRYFERH